jgi:hypothetical protein
LTLGHLLTLFERERPIPSPVNSAAGETALDFMFWPSPKRRFGCYIEPAYDYSMYAFPAKAAIFRSACRLLPAFAIILIPASVLEEIAHAV